MARPDSPRSQARLRSGRGGSQVETEATRLAPDESAALGRQARTTVPRSSHAGLSTDPDRPDPVSLLESQAKTRVPELVPIRHGRMMSSPFAFFRGAALGMAADLAGTPVSGIIVQACGDAHLLNFGLYASPERRLVFDVNDFDETLPGPWEWDVKRLAASIVIAGRDRGLQHGRAQPGGARHGRAIPAGHARVRGDAHPGRLVREARGRTDRAAAAGRGAQGGGQAASASPGAGHREGGDPDQPAGREQAVPARGRPARVRPAATGRRAAGRPAAEDQRHRLESGIADLVSGYARSLAPDRRVLLDRFRWRTWPARSSGSAASAPAAGSSCSSVATSTTRSSCRRRRPSPRCWSGSSRAASTATRASGSSSASG